MSFVASDVRETGVGNALPASTEKLPLPQLPQKAGHNPR